LCLSEPAGIHAATGCCCQPQARPRCIGSASAAVAAAVQSGQLLASLAFTAALHDSMQITGSCRCTWHHAVIMGGAGRVVPQPSIVTGRWLSGHQVPTSIPSSESDGPTYNIWGFVQFCGGGNQIKINASKTI